MRVEFEIVTEQLGAVLSGRHVAPRIPEGRRIELPPTEADEPAGAIDPAGESGTRALFIVYRAADGQVSQRTVTVRQLIGDPPEMLLAWCHVRKRPRHFRFDRIVEAIDPETGELLPLEDLPGLLATEHQPLDRRVRQVVNVLVFMARCDGSVVAPEWAAIDDSLALYMVRFGGDDETHQRACKMAREVAPAGEDVVIAMRSFAASPDRRALSNWLVQALKAVVDADGTQNRAEFDWIGRIGDFLIVMREAG